MTIRQSEEHVRDMVNGRMTRAQWRMFYRQWRMGNTHLDCLVPNARGARGLRMLALNNVAMCRRMGLPIGPLSLVYEQVGKRLRAIDRQLGVYQGRLP